MGPNDVLARIVEAWIDDAVLKWPELGKLADAMEDAGRCEEAWLLRQRDRSITVYTDLEGRWYLVETVMFPRDHRKSGIRIKMGDEGQP